MKKLFGEVEGTLLINLVEHEIEYEESLEEPNKEVIKALKNTIKKIKNNKGE